MPHGTLIHISPTKMGSCPATCSLAQLLSLLCKMTSKPFQVPLKVCERPYVAAFLLDSSKSYSASCRDGLLNELLLLFFCPRKLCFFWHFTTPTAPSPISQLDFRTPPGFDRTRNAEIGNKDIKFKHLEEAFTSEHWLVRIYKVKNLGNREPLDRKPRSVVPKQKYTSKKVQSTPNVRVCVQRAFLLTLWGPLLIFPFV